MGERGDAEAARGADALLEGREVRGALGGGHGGRAEGAGELAQTVCDGLVLGDRAGLLALVRGHVAGVRVDAAPQAVQLRALLLERHSLDQTGGPFGRVRGGVGVHAAPLKGPGTLEPVVPGR